MDEMAWQEGVPTVPGLYWFRTVREDNDPEPRYFIVAWPGFSLFPRAGHPGWAQGYEMGPSPNGDDGPRWTTGSPVNIDLTRNLAHYKLPNPKMRVA